MGRLSAMDMAENAPLDVALSWHLFSNHYPPLPSGCVEIATEVIWHMNAGGSADQTFDISSIGEHRRYGTLVPAHEIIDAWHLDSFIDWNDPDEWTEEDGEELLDFLGLEE